MADQFGLNPSALGSDIGLGSAGASRRSRGKTRAVEFVPRCGAVSVRGEKKSFPATRRTARTRTLPSRSRSLKPGPPTSESRARRDDTCQLRHVLPYCMCGRASSDARRRHPSLALCPSLLSFFSSRKTLWRLAFCRLRQRKLVVFLRHTPCLRRRHAKQPGVRHGLVTACSAQHPQQIRIRSDQAHFGSFTQQRRKRPKA
jgi:hypothetical protein